MIYCGQPQMDTPSATQRLDRDLRAQVDTGVRILREGGVISVPTDTLYGLAASALDERAVERVFRIKGRSERTPLPLLLSEPAEIEEYAVDIPELAWKLSDTFFPGPLTLVLRKGRNIPAAVSGGLDTVGMRVPDHWVPRAIVRELGTAITGTSANRTGAKGPETADDVRRQLGDDVDYVVDAGRCPGSTASTVLDLSGPSPVIVREGAVSRKEIESVCGERVVVRG